MLGPRIPAAGCKRPSEKRTSCRQSCIWTRRRRIYTRPSVPITQGERRKAKLEREKNAQSGKRTYRTKKDRPRLCADDVMARDKLKAYQTTYAEAMAKYGLQRGIEGSEAKHISTQQYYREGIRPQEQKSPSRSRISKNSDKP
ncbi:MAG: plasmid recombination protein [Alistipes onderdonkii]